MDFQEKDFGRGAELNEETLKNVSGGVITDEVAYGYVMNICPECPASANGCRRYEDLVNYFVDLGRVDTVTRPEQCPFWPGK